MTKVEAIVRVMQDNGGQATWSEIYDQISRYYNSAKASTEWQAGIRGVLYRELRNGRTFKKVGPATFALINGNYQVDVAKSGMLRANRVTGRSF